MRPSTLAELADTAGIPVPEIRGYGSFTAFADTYLAACQVLRTPEDFARLVYEVVEDSVLDGAVWVEPSFYAPHHRDRFGADEDIIDMVLDAAALGRREPRCGRRRDGRGRPHGRSGGRDRPGADRRDASGSRRRLVRPGQRRGDRSARALRARRSRSPRKPGCSPPRTRASSPDRSRCGVRSTPWRPIDCSTASGRSKIPSCVAAPGRFRHLSRRLPDVEPAAVGLLRRSPSTRFRSCSRPGSGAA